MIKETPLNVVTELISDSMTCDNQQERNEMLTQAKANSELLMSLIYDILDNAQLQENKIKINLQQFELINTLENVVNLLKVQTKLKKVSLKLVNLLNDNYYQIVTDPKRLKQILINIIGNAIKFTNQGFIELRVSKFQDNIIKFEVIDTGTGIKKEVIPKLTQPYATFGNELEENVTGVGLGLNFCKEIIGMLGPIPGIFISSIYGQGSKFGFLIYNEIEYSEEILQQCCIYEKELYEKQKYEISALQQMFEPFNLTPFKKEKNEILEFKNKIDRPTYTLQKYIIKQQTEKNDIKQKFMNNSNSLRLNILIADDNAFNILILNKQLKKIQSIAFNIYEAFNGKQAVEMFTQYNQSSNINAIDIIFMDCDMPIQNGYEASLKIKQKIETQRFKDVIIYALTAYVDQEISEKCLENKMDFVLSKPVNFTNLSRIIESYCSSKTNQNMFN